ncbi:phage minor tail protein G, partial [Escherichia coli]|nr:phage minor tail protein G [Escherichia coli]EJA1463789.1 phage minor tail protein G [Escherichia coli]
MVSSPQWLKSPLLKRALQGKRRSYMFLKTEQFEYNGVSVTLSE